MQTAIISGIATFAIFLAISLPAVASEELVPPPGDEVATDLAKEPEYICRRIRTTGSKIAKRTCHTPKEWRNREIEAKETARQLSNGTSTMTFGASTP